MKVAIVLNTSWNIFNFRMNLVRALVSQGFEVHTIAPEDPYTARLVEAGCHHHPVRMDSRGINPVKDLALILEFAINRYFKKTGKQGINYTRNHIFYTFYPIFYTLLYLKT